jgi:hypothetical protein
LNPSSRAAVGGGVATEALIKPATSLDGFFVNDALTDDDDDDDDDEDHGDDEDEEEEEE